jgi:hypothetical protein
MGLPAVSETGKAPQLIGRLRNQIGPRDLWIESCLPRETARKR